MYFLRVCFIPLVSLTAVMLATAVVSGAEENETNSQYYDALEGLVGRRDVNFESSELLIELK